MNPSGMLSKGSPSGTSNQRGQGGGEGLRHASHDLSKTSMRVVERADAKGLLLWGEYMQLHQYR